MWKHHLAESGSSEIPNYHKLVEQKAQNSHNTRGGLNGGRLLMDNYKMVKVNGEMIQKVEYKNQPVITLSMMDEVHKRFEGAARQAFNRNKHHLIKNEDFFEVPYKEWTKIPCVSNIHAQRKDFLTFLTQTGYLLLVKTFNDKLAWKVQRELVNAYFAKQTSPVYDEYGSSGIMFFDDSSGVFADRFAIVVKQRGQRVVKQGGELIPCMKNRNCQTTMSSVVYRLLEDGRPYSVKEVSDKTGIPRKKCCSILHKAYSRGKHLDRVAYGYYQKKGQNNGKNNKSDGC